MKMSNLNTEQLENVYIHHAYIEHLAWSLEFQYCAWVLTATWTYYFRMTEKMDVKGVSLSENIKEKLPLSE